MRRRRALSWSFFIDESGQDQRESPYEVLAALAVEDRTIWPLIRQLSDAQQRIFGMRLFEAYGREAKAQKLLNAKVFRHAAQMPPFSDDERRRLAREMLTDGAAVSRERLTALGQAKVAYCRVALSLAARHGALAFATIVPRSAPRPERGDGLRKDYAFLFERLFYFLNGLPDDPMGYLVFDEIDRSACHILLGQISSYFVRTANGRARSRLIIPEPFFVHSDLTTMVQVADLIAYVISWGVRVPLMSEPARGDLDDIARDVLGLRFMRRLEAGRTQWGFKVINDLRPRNGTLT